MINGVIVRVEVVVAVLLDVWNVLEAPIVCWDGLKSLRLQVGLG